MIRDFRKNALPLNLTTPNSAPATANMFTLDYASSSYFPLFPYTMSTMQESLLTLLNADEVDEKDIIGALEEFAWASMTDGKRVREYCEELTEVIVRVSLCTRFKGDGHVLSPQAHRPTQVQRLLNTGTLAILFPFIRATSPYFPSSPAFPPPLVASTSLSAITSKQLIDSLARLSRQTPLPRPRESLYTESLIFEVVLEYVARKWNTVQDDLVEVVGRKLTEIEFEVRITKAYRYLADAYTGPDARRPADCANDYTPSIAESSIPARLPLVSSARRQTQRLVIHVYSALGSRAAGS